MTFLRITKKDTKLYCKPQLPASKSLSTRILLLKHLYPELISYDNISQADDVQILEKNLRQLSTCTASGIPYIIYAKNSGAVARFLTVFSAGFAGQTFITGEKRLFERPVADLVNSLRQMNADVEYAGKKNCFPLRIKGRKLTGGTIEIDPSKSSQFVTAILLIANELEPDLRLKLISSPSSERYIQLTIDILRKAGLDISYQKDVIDVKKSEIKPVHFNIENDWASASFWYLMLLLAEEGEIILDNLHSNSLLPEAVLPELFEPAGIHTSFKGHQVHIIKTKPGNDLIRYDFTHNPDLALPFITGIALKGRDAEFTGLGNLKYKESDRLAALTEILKELHINYDLSGDKLTLEAGTPGLRKNAIFDGKNDHRVIMTLASLAIYFRKEIRIRNYQGVEKSYPQFWLDISRAGFSVEEAAR